MKKHYEPIRDAVYESIDIDSLDNINKKNLQSQISNFVNRFVESEGIVLSKELIDRIAYYILCDLTGFGFLEDLLSDDNISEIMVNGKDDVFIEKGGQIYRSDIEFISEEQLLNVAKNIAGKVGRKVDSATPTCDTRLLDGSRVNIVIPPIALNGTVITIRKFKKDSLTFADLVRFNAMSDKLTKFLMLSARCKLNILVSGGTGSGKTTMLNALSAFIGEHERIVTIEDTAELQIQHENVVRLETRHASSEGTGMITIRDLVVNALRMRPDRVIVGECRGSEAVEMLQAMNTGHDGSMSTLHANSPMDAIARVESMVMMASDSLPLLAIRRMIVSSVDFIVQIKRLHDGSRKVVKVCEIVGLEGDQVILDDIWVFEQQPELDLNHKVVGDFVSSGLSKRSVLYQKSLSMGLSGLLEDIYDEY
ncbi:CpaF family protein [Vibrio mediterranei]|uniref:CpaF family protein n=1 Tax=Vibrio mediterranei TaxID=689 RepID=UPI001EFCF572|nr:CpaF family protein [Vibrio mediterranei]